MELFSQPFIRAVRQVLATPGAVVLGTIPAPRGKPLALVEEIRSRSDVTVFTVSAARPAPASTVAASRCSPERVGGTHFLGLRGTWRVPLLGSTGLRGAAGLYRCSTPVSARLGYRGTQARSPEAVGPGGGGRQPAAAVAPHGHTEQKLGPSATLATSPSPRSHVHSTLWSLARRASQAGLPATPLLSSQMASGLAAAREGHAEPSRSRGRVPAGARGCWARGAGPKRSPLPCPGLHVPVRRALPCAPCFVGVRGGPVPGRALPAPTSPPAA